MSNRVLGESEAPTSSYVSVADVAQLLQLSEKTVRRWIESGRLRAIRTSPVRGRIRVARTELSAFLHENRVAFPNREERTP